MATILDKNITRESTVKVNEREIQVTLTADQQISMKLKGMKSGIVSISIAELYEYVTGQPAQSHKPIPEVGHIVLESVQVTKPKRDSETGGVMISLYDLRSLSNISQLDYATKCKFDGLIGELIDGKMK